MGLFCIILPIIGVIAKQYLQRMPDHQMKKACTEDAQAFIARAPSTPFY
jgi:hypothetical protein